MVIKGHWTVTGACGPYNLGGSATITGDSLFERYWRTYAFMQIMSTSSTHKALHTPWCLSI